MTGYLNFQRQLDRSCSGCNLFKCLPAESDSLIHGYFFCPLARTYIEIYEKYAGVIVDEKFFFWGAHKEGMSKEMAFFFNLDLIILKYFIHNVRTSSKALPAMSVLVYVKSQKKILRACSFKFASLCRKMEQRRVYVEFNNSQFSMY